jgi:3-hydroxy-9,10-secoandrosta-1,3,5(10)-triene-9,17-dione monooxygenase
VWCTTAQFTDWTSLFAQVEDEKGNRSPMRTFLTPSRSMTIVETWEAHGMAGTGTHHMVCDDLFIPDSMAGDDVGTAAWGPNDPKLFPDYPVMYAAAAPYAGVAIAQTVVGAANGAVEEARKRLLTYNKRGSVVPEKEKMSQQMRLARASVLATAARLLVYEAGRMTIAHCTGPKADEHPDFYKAIAMCAEATEIARQVSTMLLQSGGTSVHYLSSPIGRHFRDIFTGSSHASVDYDPAITKWGQRMLGISPKNSLPIGEHYKMRDELKATKGGDYSLTESQDRYTETRAV